MKRMIILLFSLILVILGVSFAVINANPVRLDYYFAHTEAPLSLIVILSLATGALLGVVASFGVIASLRRKLGKPTRSSTQ